MKDQAPLGSILPADFNPDSLHRFIADPDGLFRRLSLRDYKADAVHTVSNLSDSLADLVDD